MYSPQKIFGGISIVKKSQFFVWNIILYKIVNLTCLCCVIQCHNAPTHKLLFCLFFKLVLYLNWGFYLAGGETWGNRDGQCETPEVWTGGSSTAGGQLGRCWMGTAGDGRELVMVLVQHTSFPAAPAGRMFSWVSWAECSLALRRSAAILEARRSAEVEVEEGDGSGRMGPAWEGFSTLGLGWRRSAAAVEALVRGPILEKSLEDEAKITIKSKKKRCPKLLMLQNEVQYCSQLW